LLTQEERAEARRIAMWFADPVGALQRGERSINANPMLLSLALLEAELEAKNAPSGGGGVSDDQGGGVRS
jgi:hypothetical protein